MINLEKSKLRDKLLAHYFNHAGCEMYLRELARALSVDPTNLRRELKRLEAQGIFSGETRGKQKYYYLNQNYPFLAELKKIVAGTIGIESELKNALADETGVDSSFIFGSYASGKDAVGSDVDLFLIGSARISGLADRISKVEERTNKEVNFRVFTRNDFKKAVKARNSFILNIIKNKKLFIKGDEKSFGKIYQ